MIFDCHVLVTRCRLLKLKLSLEERVLTRNLLWFLTSNLTAVFSSPYGNSLPRHQTLDAALP